MGAAWGSSILPKDTSTYELQELETKQLISRMADDRFTKMGGVTILLNDVERKDIREQKERRVK